jgi:hypothetical protein
LEEADLVVTTVTTMNDYDVEEGSSCVATMALRLREE